MPIEGISDPKLTSFVFGDDDFVIHFFQQGSKIDEYLVPGSKTTSEIIFTLSAETEAEVNQWAGAFASDSTVDFSTVSMRNI